MLAVVVNSGAAIEACDAATNLAQPPHCDLIFPGKLPDPTLHGRGGSERMPKAGLHRRNIYTASN